MEINTCKTWDAAARKKVRLIGLHRTGAAMVEDEEGAVYLQEKYNLY